MNFSCHGEERGRRGIYLARNGAPSREEMSTLDGFAAAAAHEHVGRG